MAREKQAKVRITRPGARLRASARTFALVAAGALLLAAVVSRAGLTRGLVAGAGERLQGRGPRKLLRVWDWWSPSLSEKYAAYFGEIEREFERLHPDVDLLFQFVPFIQYEQKMATGLVGSSPPDVFQSSVSWAEGFYDRGMVLPLNPYLEAERRVRETRRKAGQAVDTGASVDREEYLEAAWRHNSKPDGTVFGIPQILDANALVWNLDLLRPAADDPEIRAMFVTGADGRPNWSRLRWDAVRDWEQFRRILRRLTRYDDRGQLALDSHGDHIRAGFSVHAHGSGAAPVMPWLAANGASFQDAAGTRALFAGDAGVEAMQFLVDLYWKDHVSPSFRRQMSDEDAFYDGKVACVVAGTYSPKYILRNGEGKLRFDLTAFPPGPRGRGHTTLSWGNMLMISRRSAHPDLAWEYARFITTLPGSLRILRLLDQNSPRKDFYRTPAWREVCQVQPYLTNIPDICARGKKLRHTQISAIDHATRPVFESVLLGYPAIAAGRGPHPSVRVALESAAAAANRVFDRYNTQVEYWRQRP